MDEIKDLLARAQRAQQEIDAAGLGNPATEELSRLVRRVERAEAERDEARALLAKTVNAMALTLARISPDMTFVNVDQALARIEEAVVAARSMATGLMAQVEVMIPAEQRRAEAEDALVRLAGHLAKLEAVRAAAQKLSDVLVEFDGDYRFVGGEYWDELWKALDAAKEAE